MGLKNVNKFSKGFTASKSIKPFNYHYYIDVGVKRKQFKDYS